MEVPSMVPRLGVKSELQVPAYATATAMLGLSGVCNLHHSLRQRWILNPLSETASSWTLCQVLNLLSHNGNSSFLFFKKGIEVDPLWNLMR